MSSTSTFPLLPSHSNSKFETYRLSTSSSSTPTPTIFPLPGSAVTQGRVHGKTLLSVREVESRIKHDHLGVGWGGWFCWVDESWEVWGVRVGEDFTPHFSSLGSLPAPLPSSSSPPAEYPSVWSLSPTTYLLSDGHGRLYPLRVRPSATKLEATLLGPAYELSTGEGEDELLPFKVEWVGGQREVLISSVRRERVEGKDGWGKEKGWEVRLVRFGEDWDQDQEETMEVDSSSSSARKLEVLWKLRGDDVPLYAHFSPSSSGRFLLGSSSHYSVPHTNLTSTTGSATPPPPPTPLAQAPYSWTQTSSTVTIVFPSVPSKPTSSSFVLASKSLSIPTLQGFSPADNRSYWDSIKPSESTWTYESSSNTLTLELEKSNAQTRWPSLFSSPPSNSTQGASFEDIPETLSMEQSSAIAENLAKFTASFQEEGDEGADGSSAFAGLDGAGGMSSLMRQEMDIDDEEEQGEEGISTRKEVKWTFVSREGEVEKVKSGEVVLGREMGWGKTGGLLGGQGGGSIPSVLVKGSLDAHLFSPPLSLPPTPPIFKHIKTFPALSYVLSSKREVKYILHTPPSPSPSSSSPSSNPPTSPNPPATAAVLVFTSPTTAAAQGDCFVYYDAEGKTTARSGVVKLGGGAEGEGGSGGEGSLLGVKGVEVGERGDRVLVGLCERAVVLVRGLI